MVAEVAVGNASRAGFAPPVGMARKLQTPQDKLADRIYFSVMTFDNLSAYRELEPLFVNRAVAGKSHLDAAGIPTSIGISFEQNQLLMIKASKDMAKSGATEDSLVSAAKEIGKKFGKILAQAKVEVSKLPSGQEFEDLYAGFFRSLHNEVIGQMEAHELLRTSVA